MTRLGAAQSFRPNARRLTRRALSSAILAIPILGAGAVLAAAGPKAYVGNFADNTVSVIDTGANRVVATIPVAAGPHGMAIAPDGRRVYVAGDASSSLSIIDTATDRVVRTVQIGKSPNGIAVTADGRLLLAAVYDEDRIVFLDTASQQSVASVAVPKPHTVAISPDGKSAFVTSQAAGHFGIAMIDIAARKVTRSLPLEKTPRDGEFGDDGKAFYFTEAGVAAVEILDPASGGIAGAIPTGISPHFVKLFRRSPLGLAVVQGPGELMLFDPASKTEARRIPVGKQPHWAALSGDGKTAFVTDEGADDVTVVDLASGKTSTIAVGRAPRKIVVQEIERHAALGKAGVSIADFAFKPGVLAVPVGTTVQWRNDDGALHAVKFTDNVAKSLPPGDSFTRRFDSAGTYDYICSYHPYMAGKIIATASGAEEVDRGGSTER